MMAHEEKSEELDAALAYLYKTYFGEQQIEKEEIGRLPELLAECNLFVDIGASLGMYTYFANKILSDARIYAIEADPDRFAELQRNCVKWEKEGTNQIQAIHAIAGDSRESARFFKTGTHISGGVFAISERADDYNVVEVPQVMLDDFYQPSQKAVVKIDVEGAEYRVLNGAAKFITDDHTKFIVGIHSWGDRERGKTPMDLLRYLFSKQLNISKTSNHLTANYLFDHTEKRRAVLRWRYIKHAPLLLARQLYRGVLPKSIIRHVERSLNRLRKRKIESS
jgi:FkbM family methyltransferase